MFHENLREIFLRKFVKDLINNIKVDTLEKSSEKKIDKIEKFPLKLQNKEKNELTSEIPNISATFFGEKVEKKLDAEVVSSLAPTPLKKFGPIIATKLTKNPLKPKKVQKIITPKKIKSVPIVPPAKGYPDLGKLNLLVGDIGVEGIECIGPNKNIVVKKGGKVQRTSIILTKEEIRQLVNFFANQTKIPLTQGTFKAVLGNLILTAITSDFAGAKFIIQKRTPLTFQNPL